MKKEAQARLKINKMLEDAGWRLFDDGDKKANVRTEYYSKRDKIGDDFEDTKKGFIDYLLVDDFGRYIAVLEAKSSDKDPMDGKMQAKRYAEDQDVRYIILSNGDSHYVWDIEQGDPYPVTKFPTKESLSYKQDFKPDITNLISEEVDKGYIAEIRNPEYRENSLYKTKKTRKQYLEDNYLKELRPYQLEAIKSLQNKVEEGKKKFLFEMATGTGKTLLSGAIIKLFIKTGNAKRILFLVDRRELEKQAHRDFTEYFKGSGYKIVIYKYNEDNWQNAEIVISTIQTLSFNNKFRNIFTPMDFDLVISDEAHRSIGGLRGTSRAVLEHFECYKLGLTATPKDYLKNIDEQEMYLKTPRALELRKHLDTYITFGCEPGTPTFKYSIVDGVKDNYLINPYTIDMRTDITTQLLSNEGYKHLLRNKDSVSDNDEEVIQEIFFNRKDFERKFFSDRTNRVFCEEIVENTLRDPISNEIGKTIVFCVSQNHARKIVEILNKIASAKWPDKYNSDFAVQVTSRITDAQEMTVKFQRNDLNGTTRFKKDYESSKTRVCVTVDMMTTGYDCSDLLNIVMLRPIFSPTSFVQMKGRGTRKHPFKYEEDDETYTIKEKERFYLLDFFGNYRYFEDEFEYDKPIDLKQKLESKVDSIPLNPLDESQAEDTIVESDEIDFLTSKEEIEVNEKGMRIDNSFFGQVENAVKQDEEIVYQVNNNNLEVASEVFRDKYENKPELYVNLDKIRESLGLDRRTTWREVVEVIFNVVDKFPSREEKIKQECDNFIEINNPSSRYIPHIRNFMKLYIDDTDFRRMIDEREGLHTYPAFSNEELLFMGKWKNIVISYIKDYVTLNVYS